MGTPSANGRKFNDDGNAYPMPTTQSGTGVMVEDQSRPLGSSQPEQPKPSQPGTSASSLPIPHNTSFESNPYQS